MVLTKIVEFSTNVARWSTLKNFTRSRAAQLTVMAPFIGYLIVFNAELKSYLNLSLPENSNSLLVEWLRAHSLTFLYFGLVLYGAATAIFAIACPKKVKENDNIIEYVQKMEDIKAPNLVRRHLSRTIYLFLEQNSSERRSPFFANLHPSFPSAAATPLHLLIEALAASSITDEESITAFQTGTGHWMTDEIMESMHSERRVDRVFWMPLLAASFEHSKEVFYISYRADDFRLFFVRFFNLFLFILGLTFLIVPTIVTILAIVLSLF